MKIGSLLLVCALALACVNAEAAKRLGGGMSFGKQSSNVTKRDAAPSQSAPAQNATNSSQRQTTPPMAPASPRRPWGAMLGGLAAGLGLAWLAQSLGMGEAFGQFMMMALLAMVAMMVIGWLIRSRRPQAVATPYAMQGSAAGAGAIPLRPYSPDSVGNDASARPWERSSMAFEAGTFGEGGAGSMIGSALAGPQRWGIPAGFDTGGFLSASKANFVALQAAWDSSDIVALRAMMTDEMLGEIKSQLAEREAHSAGLPNRTEVVMLDAKLLGIEELDAAYMASVEFSGLIREEPSAGPSPFREVWNMTKPKDGSSGWLVAGVQALQ